MNIQELKASVAQLSAGDLNEFTEWFEEFIAQQNWQPPLAHQCKMQRLNQPDT